MNKKVKIIGFILIGGLFLVIAGFIIWANNPMKAELPEWDRANLSSNSFEVNDKGNYLLISSKAVKPSSGLIYYPGARVEPKSYVYKLSSIVEKDPDMGIFITKPVLNFAIFSFNDADSIIKRNSNIKTWYVGGHSLGGAMACQYTSNNENKIKGLILFASYCGDDISETNIKVLSISGSLDGLSTSAKIEKAKSNLPKSSVFIEIVGGNHAKMGNYGFQPGDNESTISDGEIRDKIGSGIKEFLISITK